MKPLSNGDLALKCLMSSVSCDGTRRYLLGVYHDGETKSAISTDGYVLTSSTLFFSEKLAGLIIDPKTCSVISAEFPRVSQVIPSIYQELEYTVEPRHFIKSVGKVPITIYFCKEGIIRLEEPTNSDDLLFKLNSKYLKPIAIGRKFKVRYTGRPLSPVVFDLTGKGDFSSFYLIMPRK